MKEIYAVTGEVINVDDDSFDHFNQYKWRIHQGYACRSIQTEKGARKMRMHREILGLGWGQQGSNSEVVDHIDRNKLNNTRENLRIVSKQENEWNRHAYSNNTSGYPGVRVRKDSPQNPYQAMISVNGSDICLGSFPTPEKAYIAYLEAKLFYHRKESIHEL